ncbi:MAG: tRNA preQ1(34) S-adenosylmethionine ribosyltransferase-isomerase QueA [Candidatus Cloacimonadota bacterium]|nr:MAG: tRNA preQ1(34) S-adenosylmethionine ribosyltransferase-isomerase QueA [Candidatus Cloacimonadota bacterium]
MNQFLLSNYSFDLPKELLAHEPPKNRVEAKLLNFSKSKIEHQSFSDIINIFDEPCLFVRNNTRVRKAKICGYKDTGGKVDGLFYKNHAQNIWEGLFKKTKRLKVGDIVTFPNEVKTTIVDKLDGGVLHIQFEENFDVELYLEEIGETPLPPYIKDYEGDFERYQTVYSDKIGAAAAPTAGLHFDQNLIDKMIQKGFDFCDVTLHVGPGTFKPIDTEDIRDFKIHSEFIEIDQNAIDKIKSAKNKGIKIVAVGTTSLRAIESVFLQNKLTKPFVGWTDIYLYPGAKVESIDYLLTNYHLSGTSLLVLVASLIGYESLMNIYQEAILKKYRFFSFGDCMIVPNLSKKLE